LPVIRLLELSQAVEGLSIRMPGNDHCQGSSSI
jgi:hypothetical protein